MKKVILKFKEGDEVCFMNQAIELDVDVVEKIYKPVKSDSITIRLQNSKLLIKEQQQDMLFPISRAVYLNCVIKILQRHKEAGYSVLKEMMLEQMGKSDALPKAARMAAKVKEGDEVCYMNQSVAVEIDTVERIYKPAKSNKIAIQLKYSKLVVRGEDQDMLFPKEKAERLYAVIQQLKLSTETEFDKLKAMMIEMMVQQESLPLYLPQPNGQST